MSVYASIENAPRTLERVVTGHMRRFPWYADLLRRSGGQPGELGTLPLIDQPILERHYYTGPELPGASIFHTSGTARGVRKRIQYSDWDDDAYTAQRRRLFADFLHTRRTPGTRVVCDLGTGHAAALSYRVFADLGMDTRDVDFTAPLSEHVAAINSWQPDVLFTMPMILDQMLHAGPALTARPRTIIVVGDLAPPAWRANVAARFGIATEDVLDIVGSIEVGAIAYLDTRIHRYVFHDHIVAEVAEPDSDGNVNMRNCHPHGDGVLVLTSMAREYFPAIRYVTGDLVADLRKAEVEGRSVTSCARFLGRTTGDVKHGERISSHDLSQAVASVFPGHPFEVSEGGTLCVHVVADHVAEEQRRALNQAVREAAPDVAAMMEAGIVGEIDVVATTLDALRSGPAKRRFNLPGA
ncbi:hypothetical protein RIF23_04810 [Lipingzhangella sp. LS1_29]|uniref:Uncharacterized protein n=1 Tax=Lipingzhangella rawalii TaxID=2055835 RepID=A0ABU2H434_9ACTN|nr:hypothetical protein [Lipingzhangella rawalii]MDS1269610.1 hypothetical protein [Lipingzhangella rawalii]